MTRFDIPPELVRDAQNRVGVSDEREAIIRALKIAVRTSDINEAPSDRHANQPGVRCQHCNLVIEQAPQWCPEQTDDFCTPDITTDLN